MRIRTIKPSFWSSSKLARVSHLARLESEASNLTTACEPCNLGKAAVPLETT